MLDLGIVILSYNTKELTIKAIQSIKSKSWRINYKILVVDNASTDGTVEKIRKEFGDLEVIASKKNLGFSKGNNLGLKRYYKQCRYCLLLNSDTRLSNDSLDNLVEFADGGWDVASCKLLNTDGSFQPNGGEIPNLFPLFIWLSGLDDILKKIVRLKSYQERDKRAYKNGMNIGWVSGSVMLIKSKILEKIGFLDEKIFMYGEDVDFCWRAKKAGYKIGWTDKADTVHIGGASSKKPKYNQWLGEFKGLLYLYQKYFGIYAKILLKILIYIFVTLRIFAFLIVGKPEFSKTYAKILFNL